MSVGVSGTRFDISKTRPGVVFDADGITLIGKFTNEMAAHRAKKRWSEILQNHFLLENEQDYEMLITSVPEENYYVVGCCFVSACGRYAFWRLINQQAPEAEDELLSVDNTSKKKPKRIDTSYEDLPWVLSGPKKQKETRFGQALAERIQALLKSF